MGFAFPTDERDGVGGIRAAQVPAAPAVQAPLQLGASRLDAIDHDELHEIVVDAWRMVVPKRVAAAYDG
jgi:hypothetical protein